jgi:hypothetical protein
LFGVASGDDNSDDGDGGSLKSLDVRYEGGMWWVDVAR